MLHEYWHCSWRLVLKILGNFDVYILAVPQSYVNVDFKITLYIRSLFSISNWDFIPVNQYMCLDVVLSWRVNLLSRYNLRYFAFSVRGSWLSFRVTDGHVSLFNVNVTVSIFLPKLEFYMVFWRFLEAVIGFVWGVRCCISTYVVSIVNRKVGNSAGYSIGPLWYTWKDTAKIVVISFKKGPSVFGINFKTFYMFLQFIK